MGTIKTQHLPNYKISDYQSWPGDWELIKGIPFSMTPSANRAHKRLASKLHFAIQLEINRANCSCEVYYELDLILEDDTVLRPDLMIICEEFDDYPRIPPQVVIEILSPESQYRDRHIKFDLYYQFGVAYYLLADPVSNQIEGFYKSSDRFELLNLDKPLKLRDCEIMIHPQY